MLFEDDVHGDRAECERMARESRMDYWDQPCGPWDGENANSFYRMGGQALARDADDPGFWLRRAADYHHTGAFFRMAVLSLRQENVSYAIRYLRAAQFCDHEDARALLQAWASCQQDGIDGLEAEAVFLCAVENPQDPAFAAEAALLLAQFLGDASGCD
ncbi:hypothetical protein ACWGHU_03315 [Streptomyces xanthophaeus]